MKYRYGIAERSILPMVLCWNSTVYKMQAKTIEYEDLYLCLESFTTAQVYVARSRVKSFDNILSK